MGLRRRLLLCGSSAFVLVAGTTALAPPAVAATTTYTVGVDGVAVPGHNFEYTDFFPRASLQVHTGDIVDFSWGTSLDGFHTATVLKQGTTPAQEWAANPIAVADGDDSAGQLQFNPAIAAPSPLGCGTSSASPCAYDGSGDVSSGANPTGIGANYFVQVNVPAGTTVSFVCRVHPGMAGSLQVVSNGSAASSLGDVQSAATAQLASDTAGALAAEAAVDSEAVTTKPDGTHDVTITAGTETQFVQVAEMLPQNVHIAAGDTVTWRNGAHEPHTVTFPQGSGSDSADPLPTVCETGPPDTPAPGGPPPTFGCAAPAETHFDPQPQGTTVISSPTTLGSSGVLGNPPTPFPSSYSFTFPNHGAFVYQCRIHDHMTGAIFAGSAPAYWMTASDGGVFPFAAASGNGSLGGTHLNKPIVGMAATPDAGYWLVASDGGIFPFGDATPGLGSLGGTHLNAPVVGMAAAPDMGGYWLAAADGGVFPFGTAARGLGSMGGQHLNAPIVGVAATPTGKGYWLVASDGGVFPFGDARGLGSMGGQHLNKPVVGMAATATGRGYWLVAADGGIFPFGDAVGYGSTGAMHLNQPIVGMAATVHGLGYWLVAADGGVFPFGDAVGAGSLGGTHLNQPVVGTAGI